MIDINCISLNLLFLNDKMNGSVGKKSDQLNPESPLGQLYFFQKPKKNIYMFHQ